MATAVPPALPISAATVSAAVAVDVGDVDLGALGREQRGDRTADAGSRRRSRARCGPRDVSSQASRSSVRGLAGAAALAGGTHFSRIVTSSSAALGCRAIVASKSALVAFKAQRDGRHLHDLGRVRAQHVTADDAVALAVDEQLHEHDARRAPTACA